MNEPSSLGDLVESAFLSGSLRLRVALDWSLRTYIDRDGHFEHWSTGAAKPEAPWFTDAEAEAPLMTDGWLAGLSHVEVTRGRQGASRTLDVVMVPTLEETAKRAAERSTKIEAFRVAQAAALAETTRHQAFMEAEERRPLDPARLALLRDAWLATERPALEVLATAPGSSGAIGRRGGVPLWPAGRRWPTNDDGTPMDFVAEIRLDLMPPLDCFPTTGLLQFFEDMRDWTITHAVAWHEAGLDPGSCGTGPASPLPEAALVTADGRLNRAPLEQVMSETPSLADLWWGPEREVVSGEDQATALHSHVGGHTRFPDDERVDDEMCLLRLGPDYRNDVFWGDGGAIGFAIRRDALLARDFGSTRYAVDLH